MLKGKHTNKWIGIFVSSVFMFLLAGCGGGGSGGSSTPTPTSVPSSISSSSTSSSSSSQSLPLSGFESAGPFDIFIGASMSNIAHGAGTISYTSSDSTVAKIDAAGKVDAISVGWVTITATDRADVVSTYSYRINVLPTAPNSLNNIRTTLYVNKASPLSSAHIAMGGITTYFSESRFVEDASDSDIGKLYGTYTLTAQTGQKQNQLVVNAQNSYDLVRTTLTFITTTSGTFARNYYDPAGAQIIQTQSGDFSLSEVPFDILPKDFTNLIFELDFTKADSSLPQAESPVINQNFNVTFLQNNRVNFLPSAQNAVGWDSSYSSTTTDKFNVVVKGAYETNGRSYQLNLTFTSFIAGSFTLNIDGGKAVASGNFSTTVKNTIEHAALKGQVIKGAEITSTNTHITYPYSVYLPPNYSTSGKKYPVIYAVDGQWGDDLNYIVDQKSKDVILVQIEQGPWDQRMIDYSPVGGMSYSKFLKQEFVPLIESTYNTNHERTFFGGSVAGILGAILLGDEPVGTPFFKNYILGDGTFWWYTADLYQAELTRYNTSSTLSVNLLLSTSPQGNPDSVEVFAKRYGDRHYQGINIMMKVYPVPHENTAIPTFIDYIDVLF